jgi:hypothetical protein
MALTVTSTSVTLSAGVAAQILSADATRQLLLRSVTGANPATFKWGSAPATALDGLVLDNTTAQGARVLLTGVSTPVDSLWAFSTLGTTVAVEVGRTN